MRLERADPGGSVLAHGIGGRQDLPLPFELVLQGAAVALLASFLALGMLWRTPRLRGSAAGHPLPAWAHRVVDGTPLRWVLRAAGLALAGYVAAAATLGPDDALNPAPYAVYVLFWVGLVPASLAAGPVWRVLNPLRTLHSLVARVARVDPERGLVAPPARLGYWPAALSLASFVWLELAAPGGAGTHALRVYFGAYALVHLTAAVVFGSRWFGTADGFEVYSALVARLCPFGRRGDGHLVVRNPLDGAATLDPAPGVVALVAVLLGSTAFDSLSAVPTWVRLVQGLPLPAVVPATAGLAALICLVAATYTAATLLAGRALTPPDGRPAGDGWDGGAGRGRAAAPAAPGLMAHSLLPIIVGYVAAHYFSYLVLQGQQALILASDPLGTGADLLGTGARGVDFSLAGPTTVALVQVTAVVGGHVLAVVSAHDRAVALLSPLSPLSRFSRFSRHRRVAGQLPLLVLMLGYTVGGLMLLFAG